jgi:hypothetical protein
MRHIDKQNDYESLGKRLLSLFHSGVYISSYDIVKIGDKIGYTLPFKQRDILLQKLIGEAKREKKLKVLITHIQALILIRMEQYRKLGNEHPYARETISGWLQKAKSTHLLLQKEIQGIIDEH